MHSISVEAHEQAMSTGMHANMGEQEGVGMQPCDHFAEQGAAQFDVELAPLAHGFVRLARQHLEVFDPVADAQVEAVWRALAACPAHLIPELWLRSDVKWRAQQTLEAIGALFDLCVVVVDHLIGIGLVRLARARRLDRLAHHGGMLRLPCLELARIHGASLVCATWAKACAVGIWAMNSASRSSVLRVRAIWTNSAASAPTQ